MKIDFVIPWVDGSDPGWRKEKNKYMKIDEIDAGDDRYRDMEILKYWFRAVEKYAPWVNKVHFITWGHLPGWINENCEKLNIVNHSDYIPHEYLPTFSSHPIELNIHRIKDLSEHFVYFNDDMFLNAPVSKDFFFKKGIPCDYAYCENVYYNAPNHLIAHIYTNCIAETNRHFSYNKAFFKHPFKYVNYRYSLKNNIKNVLKLENTVTFVGFDNHHLPAPYLKQTFEDAWRESEDVLDEVSRNKFRTAFDVSQSVFRYRQLAQGTFMPVDKESRGKFLRIENDNTHIEKALFDHKIKMVCINDTPFDIDYEKAKREVIAAYEKKLPDKSTFEK